MVFIIFILGIIFGSFANVLIYRIPKKISIVFPNSFCPFCFSSIKWYDNIPILSYFLLKGRCRSCNQKISLTYPLVEFLCGVVAVFCYLKFGIFEMWVFFNFLFVLLVISFIDINTTEIPDELSYYLIFSGILLSIFNSLLGKDLFSKMANSVVGGLVGFFVSYLIGFFGEKIFKKPSLGGGDIKLFTAVGAWLGWMSLFKIIFLSSFFALVYIFLVSLYKKVKMWGKYIQFAPFISFSCLIYIFFIT